MLQSRIVNLLFKYAAHVLLAPRVFITFVCARHKAGLDICNLLAAIASCFIFFFDVRAKRAHFGALIKIYFHVNKSRTTKHYDAKVSASIHTAV